MKKALAFLMLHYTLLAGLLLWPRFVADKNAVSELAMGVCVLVSAIGWIVVTRRTAEAVPVGILAGVSYALAWNMAAPPMQLDFYVLPFALSNIILVWGTVDTAVWHKRV